MPMGGQSAAGDRARARALALTPVLLVILLLATPPAEACFRSLRRPSYETLWLGTYYDSRIVSATCFALRSFRWALKLLKVTYEGWHVEMEFAKCMSDSYGMNLPIIDPPWKNHARMIRSDFTSQGNDGELLRMIEQTPLFSEIPVMAKNGLIKLSSADIMKRNIYNRQQWGHKMNLNKIVPPFEPFLVGTDKISDPSTISSYNSQPAESMQEIIRISRALFQIFRSLLHEFEILFSRTFGSGILSCTRKYFQNAFWRWVDKAPFLK